MTLASILGISTKTMEVILKRKIHKTQTKPVIIEVNLSGILEKLFNHTTSKNIMRVTTSTKI